METLALQKIYITLQTNGFFEKQASDLQIALAYFVVFLSFCTSARNEANTLPLASCAQLLLYRY